MARTVNEIYNQMIEAKEAENGLAGLTSTSAAAIWRLLLYVVAYCEHVLEVLFDTHKNEVTTIINTLKPHTALWYAEKAKMFQYGFDLYPDSDQFNNEGKTDTEIEDSKIVKYASVIDNNDYLQIKVAKEENNDLAELDDTERQAVAEYLARIKDAGIYIELVTLPAEQMKFEITVYYNPLVLDGEGRRLDGTNNNPVKEAVHEFLKNVEFDGTIVLAYLTDTLQGVEGVEIPVVNTAYYQVGAAGWTAFSVMHRPGSGYARVSDENIIITYIARSAT